MQVVPPGTQEKAQNTPLPGKTTLATDLDVGQLDISFGPQRAIPLP
jgi:hypothetical protein